MKISVLPKQPNWIVSYFRVGRLLYGALLLFIIESWVYGVQLKKAIYLEATGWIVFWALFFLFSFVHIYLVIMDGWSRYQNYKRAKDQFFIHGFREKIAVYYIGSKCQRMAAETAAEELGIKEDVQNYYRECGVKWYHYIPYFMIKEPFFLFKKIFWSRTFLEDAYEPKFDYQAMFKSQTA
ncbi:MAG: hypothetical protein CMC13_05130 [Flavobacteriaceae bacterium]|nr:hypothetical protein [Flavobacteriaceae bacterium]|tara:strand:+ start:2213 stop:2755 length:543 start_codon:yes stop_codon:yes gene_type:complete